MIPKHVLELYHQGKIKPGDALHWQYFESKNTPFDLSRQDRIDRGDWTEEQYRPRHELAKELAEDSHLSNQILGEQPFDIEIAARNIDQILDSSKKAFLANAGSISTAPEETASTSTKENADDETASSKRDKDLWMEFGEFLKGPIVDFIIYLNRQNIASAAGSHSVDPGLIAAIIYEEQTHIIPVAESLGEYLGFGNTVGLGQISIGYYDKRRYELLNRKINVDTIGRHLATVAEDNLIDENEPIASLATKYNCGSCASLTPYGRQVKSYYQDQKPWFGARNAGGGGGW